MVRVLSLLLVALLLGGCVRSLQPVLKPEQVVKMPEIAGKWVSIKNEKEGLDVTPADDGFKVTYRSEKGEPGQYVARIGRIGDLLIADVMPAEPSEKSGSEMILMVPVHTVFIITQTSPQLAGRTLDYNWFKDYVPQHPDELATTKSDSELLITATTEQIQQFVTKHVQDEKAWTEESVFMRPPATQPAAPKP